MALIALWKTGSQVKAAAACCCVFVLSCELLASFCPPFFITIIFALPLCGLLIIIFMPFAATFEIL